MLPEPIFQPPKIYQEQHSDKSTLTSIIHAKVAAPCDTLQMRFYAQLYKVKDVLLQTVHEIFVLFSTYWPS